MLPRFGWRAVFLVGLLPALVTVWVRRRVREPEAWLQQARRPLRPAAVPGLRCARDAGDRGDECGEPVRVVGTVVVGAVVPLAAGGGGRAWAEYGADVLVDDRYAGGHVSGVHELRVSWRTGSGGRRMYITFLLVAAALVPLYAFVLTPLTLLLLGPLVGFWGTGYFSGFAVIASEAFPTALRGRAMGFAYNLGRIVSAGAPFLVGYLAERRGMGAGLLLTSCGVSGGGGDCYGDRRDWAADAPAIA